MGRQGWTNTRLAEAVGTRTRQSVGKRINGEIPWDVAELEKIAAALGVPVAQFMPATITTR
jgi:hypothetical protein